MSDNVMKFQPWFVALANLVIMQFRFKWHFGCIFLDSSEAKWYQIHFM